MSISLQSEKYQDLQVLPSQALDLETWISLYSHVDYKRARPTVTLQSFDSFASRGHETMSHKMTARSGRMQTANATLFTFAVRYPNFAYFGHAAGECKTFFELLFLHSNVNRPILHWNVKLYIRM